MTAIVVAIVAFVFAITVVDEGRMPLPGGGVAIVWMPAVAWFTVDRIMRRLGTSSDYRAALALGWILTAVCIYFVWSSLATETHQTCVEGTRIGRGEYECERYAIVPGPDTEHALLWGVLGTFAFTLTRIARLRDSATSMQPTR